MYPWKKRDISMNESVDEFNVIIRFHLIIVNNKQNIIHLDLKNHLDRMPTLHDLHFE